MKKIAFVLLAATLMLGACNSKDENKQSSAASPAAPALTSDPNAPSPAPQELLDREAAKKPTGDITKDATDLFEAIKVLTIDHKSDKGAEQAQALSEIYSAYYRDLGKLEQFKKKLTEVTVASAEKEKAERAKQKSRNK